MSSLNSFLYLQRLYIVMPFTSTTARDAERGIPGCIIHIRPLRGVKKNRLDEPVKLIPQKTPLLHTRNRSLCTRACRFLKDPSNTQNNPAPWHTDSLDDRNFRSTKGRETYTKLDHSSHFGKAPKDRGQTFRFRLSRVPPKLFELQLRKYHSQTTWIFSIYQPHIVTSDLKFT